MKIIGFHILSGKIYYAVLDGTKQNPSLIEKNKKITLSTNSIPESMDWFETTFENIINRINPDEISYRQSLNLKKNQQYNISFPYGILNLLSFKKSIPINSWVPQNFVASKLGMTKGTDLISACDHTFGQNPPYWDVNMKNAILAAWMSLD